MTRTRAWAAWTLLSIIVGIAMSYLIAIAYTGRGVETALAAYCWGVAYTAITPAVLRAVGRLV